MQVSRMPEYRSWCSMMERCFKEYHAFFSNYGGRGITVCKRWKKFSNFFLDMGSRPTPKHTIERIDNNKGYYPGNCKWATRTEQARNRTSNRFITVNGVTKLLIEWCIEKSINHSTVIRRIRRGWSNEKAVMTPGSGKPHSCKRTHCPHGHPYDKENTKIVITRKGQERQCRQCIKRYNKKQNDKKLARKRAAKQKPPDWIPCVQIEKE